MKCGAPGCEHVECAIEARKARSRGLKMIIYISTVGTVIVLAVIYFFALEPSTILISGAWLPW
ncbi:MAG: hypothetical protein LUQ49_02200 [Methanomicrobiales archaeon]|nr:hypothetical protein [Methanomicrobiales archaeon]